MFEITFEKQLEKTLKISSQYTIEREKLKKKFCDKYDNISIMTLLNSLAQKGHPSEKEFAAKFKEHYESDNYSEQEISEFTRLFIKYKKEVIDNLETNGE
ncbi:MAG: hypothetical protein J6C64_00665 [Lachnospiraceae bacterium]|nr:hypothetical protein [Lachnospiraceae bacterium]